MSWFSARFSRQKSSWRMTTNALIRYERRRNWRSDCDCQYSGVTMRLGPFTWLIRSSAAQQYAEWIFLCFRDCPAVCCPMSGRQLSGRPLFGRHSDDSTYNGRSDGWATLSVEDRYSWSCWFCDDLAADRGRSRRA
jgi:hypothetical protein